MKSSQYPSFGVMVVDDEQNVLDVVKEVLKSAGITNTRPVKESISALETLEREEIGVVLLDLTMPGLSGEELIPLIRRENPDIPIIIITGNREVDTAVECMKAGVEDYLTKPMEPQKLIASVRRFIEIQELKRENGELARRYFTSTIDHPEVFSDILTSDPGMLSLMRYVEAIARTGQPVLITGETGTGKELIARALHNLSGRSGDFVAVNTAGLDDSMFSDTLFGHRTGAFTGAASSRKGIIESAAGGTLFLDEIGDLSGGSQVKLLRLLESREYYPLGSDVARRSEARIVVATNRNLMAAIEEADFRKDLYYRLRTHQVNLPPLRSRPDDIPLLLRHFAHQASEELGKSAARITRDLILLMRSYAFPGNIRELRSMVFDAVSRMEGEDLPLEPFQAALKAGLSLAAEKAQNGDEADLTIRGTVDRLIARALDKTHGNRTAAARLLGITPQALWQRLKRVEQDKEVTGP